MNELEQRIVNSTQDSTFLKLIYDEYCKNINEDYEISHTLIKLHNQKIIDVISEFYSLSNTSADFNFFQIRHILGDVIPFIDCSVKEVKNCVRDLTVKAGNDMASHDLISPFIEFCSADIDRVESLLEQELKVTDDDFDHISTALISGYKINKKTYFNKAVQLLNHRNPIIVQRVIFALSRFNYNEEPELAATVVKEIITCTESIEDEQILSTATNTLITLLADYEDLEPDIIEFFERNIGNNDPDFIFRIAQQLNYRHANLSENIQRLLLSFFKDINIDWKGVINQIDLYIYKKISELNAINIAELFEYILSNNSNSLDIGVLTNSLRRLREKEYEEVLSSIFTRWLLKREMIYCVSAVKLVKTSTTDQIKIGFDTGQVKVEDLMYLVNKAIGWFSIQPSTSLSLILSIVPMFSKSEIEIIGNKTFEFIALNYSSQTKNFLQEYLDSSDKNTVDFSGHLIEKLKSFLEKFNKLYEVKELRPSTRHRSEYANYQQNLFSEAMAKPLEGSLVDMFFPNKKVTLYGNKFIHKHKDFSGNTIRQVMPFSKMSHSIDFPSLANLTPHTLQYSLYKFQFEELVNETNP